MIAIPMRAIQKLTLALPKCLICQPDDAGCSKIVDRAGVAVADINWHVPSITVYNDYEYADEVVGALGKDKFIERNIEFDHAKPKEVEQIEGFVASQFPDEENAPF